MQNLNTQLSKHKNSSKFADLTAERILLETLLVNDKELIQEALSILRPYMFYDVLNAELFKIIEILITKNYPIQYTTIIEHLQRDPAYENHIDICAQYYAELFVPEDCFAGIEISHQINVIIEMYIKRELIESSKELQKDVENIKQNETTQDLLFKYISKLQNLRTCNNKEETISELSVDIINRLQAGNKTKTFYETSFLELDHLIRGCLPGELIIIGAQASVGKTAFMLNLAVEKADKIVKALSSGIIEESQQVAIFSLEMTADQLTTRILSYKLNLNITDYLSAEKITPEQLESIKQSYAEHVQHLPITICNDGFTIEQLISKAKKLHLDNKLSMICIDYIQLITTTGSPNNRVLEIANITRQLKLLAQELEIPIIALSQLSRALMNREDKTPLLSDLRESGAIEQDADKVLLLYRSDYQTINNKAVTSECKVIVAKNRNGDIGELVFSFSKNVGKFASRSKYYSLYNNKKDSQHDNS